MSAGSGKGQLAGLPGAPGGSCAKPALAPAKQPSRATVGSRAGSLLALPAHGIILTAAGRQGGAAVRAALSRSMHCNRRRLLHLWARTRATGALAPSARHAPLR